MSTIYFSHPLDTYGTQQSLAVLQWLTKKCKRDNKDIIDPEDFISSSNRLKCSICRKDRLEKELFPIIDKCDALIIWNPLDSCLIKCEAAYAWSKGKRLGYLELEDIDSISVEEMSLQEFYQIDLVSGGLF